jgi:hypothetical protein
MKDLITIRREGIGLKDLHSHQAFVLVDKNTASHFLLKITPTKGMSENITLTVLHQIHNVSTESFS